VARPKHKPTKAQRDQVEALAGFGLTQNDISTVIGIDRKTLALHYPKELEGGGVRANAAVAQSLYRKAVGVGPMSLTAAIFWMKTRGGWKETNVNEIKGKVGAPVAVIISGNDAKL
jgi:hypothetical protein